MSADVSLSHRAIENLIARYAELVDDGDFAGVDDLLAGATFVPTAGPVSGRGEVEKALRQSLVLHADGTPGTQHVTTNIAIEVDEAAGTATARSYVTVLQALPDFPLQIVAAGRYHDRFERRGGEWRFLERRIRITLAGDRSRHLHRATEAG